MDGFKAYRYYLAIKLHFTTDKFNVFENRGNVKGTREAFNARNDRYIFEKLALKRSNDKEIIQFFVANFAYGKDTSIYEGKEAEDNYIEWMKRKQSVTKVFIDDLAAILHLVETEKLKHSAIFEFTENEYPITLKMFIGGKITIESLRILDDFTDIIEKWKIHPSVKYIWDDELRRVTKLTGFVKDNVVFTFKSTSSTLPVAKLIVVVEVLAVVVVGLVKIYVLAFRSPVKLF